MNDLSGTDQFRRVDGRTYLNAASVALMPRAAEEAIIEWQRDVARNGTVNFGENPEETVFDGLHKSAAQLFGATTDDIAVAASFSELLGSLAWAMAPAANTNIVGTDVGFPSTLYPWVRVARRTGCEIRLAPSRNMRVDPDQLLDQIDERTAVVCISHVEFGSGQRFDLKQLADGAHAHDALLVVDATQSAGAIPINVRASDIDVLITAGYKWLCGPFGAAVMVLAPHLHERFDPGLVGFRSHRRLWDLAPVRMQLPETAAALRVRNDGLRERHRSGPGDGHADRRRHRPDRGSQPRPGHAADRRAGDARRGDPLAPSQRGAHLNRLHAHSWCRPSKESPQA